MTDLSHKQPFYFSLSKKDRIFTIVVIAIILIVIAVLLSDPQKPGFDINSIQIPFVSTLSLAVLSALVFASIYAYLLFQNSSFLFIAFCWLANLIYTIFGMRAITEQQMYITFIVALTADVPLFLSAFSEKQRKWWLPLLPLSVIVLSIIIYTLFPFGFHNLDPQPSQAPPSPALLTLYIIGPVSSALILFWTSYALYFKGVLDKSIKYIKFYSLTFLVLGLLQLPFIYKSLCYFAPSLLVCPYREDVLSITKIAILATKVANMAIIFIIIKNGLIGLYRKQESAEQRLKIKGEFEELGFFAASIEHELRNPLEVIGDEIEFLKSKTQSNEELHERFRILERQLNRMSVAADIINVLRAKRQDIVRKIKPILVITIVDQAIKYVKKELSQQTANIFFRVAEHTKQLTIEAYSPLLEQCFVNILKNSVESINKAKRSGEIGVELSLNEKDVVAITFNDNGNGFIVEDIPKLIDPSYTKKDLSNAKSNRGLGLFVCYKIVALHNGRISFSNHESGGATVRIEFPRYITKKMLKEASLA